MAAGLIFVVLTLLNSQGWAEPPFVPGVLSAVLLFVLDDLAPLALVPMFLAWAVLYAFPTDRRRIMLWLRVAHALSLIGGLALIVYSVVVDARSVWEPVRSRR